MSDVNIFWDPMGFELDSMGTKRLHGISDGDTPIIRVSIRMLSIDTPEKSYNGRPSRQDENLAQLAGWINAGQAPIDDDLAEYMVPRLSGGSAGTLQETQGKKASEVFQQLLDEKLTKPSGAKRQLYVRTADQPFDSYGRLLAYVSPRYTKEELKNLSPGERATFNLLMVKSGWAASFLIYPSLPKHRDLVLLHNAAWEAFDNRKGAWEEPNNLTGYEFRMCVKLFKITKKLVAGRKLSSSERFSWISRFCTDLTTREIYYPQKYFKVKPYNRVFTWSKDVSEAVGMMNLKTP